MKSLSKRSMMNCHFPYSQIYDVINSSKFSYNFPAASDFAGPYVIEWTGAGGLFLFSLGDSNFTISAGLSTPFSKTNPDRFTATTADPRIVFSWDTGEPIRTDINAVFPSGSTDRVLMRLADEADYIAGKYFRSSHLQILAELNPSSIRAMNWFGGNDSHFMRWEDRSLLTDVNWRGVTTQSEPNPSGDLPLYGTTSGTNIYTLSAIGSTPAIETHGTVVQCKIGTGMVRGGANTVTGVTRANPGVVTYSGADNYQNGDKVVFRVTAGMTELDYRICTVANVNTGANTFELSGLDTSGFTAWSSGTVVQYISLQVGTWGAYPVIFSDGVTGAANYASAYIATNDWKTFYFDKSMICGKDETTGANIQGAWIFNNLGSANYHRAGVPPALLVKFIAELNAISDETIDLWVNIPQRGLLSMDSDYTAASNVAIRLVDLFLNGGDGVAAAPSNVRLMMELSNETWNNGGAFSANSYYGRRGQLRWGGSATQFIDTYHAIRHAVMVSDIRAAFPNDLDRIIFVMAGQGTIGVGGGNLTRMDGDATLVADSLYQSVGGGAIGTNKQFWDAFAFASYFETPAAFDAANLTTLTDAWVNGNATEKDQAITDYMAGMSPLSGETLANYRDVKLPDYNTKMIALDRFVIGYEGANQYIISGSVTDQYNFLWAAKSSSQWAALYRTWLDKWKSLSNAAMPGELKWSGTGGADHRWDHLIYGYEDIYANDIEGGSLDLAWDQMTDYNNNRRRARLTATA